MLILRLKEYFDKKPYYTLGGRIKETIKGGFFGATAGAIVGGLLGAICGKKGAAIGATALGVISGIGAAKENWFLSSNKAVDSLNKLSEEAEKRRLLFEENIKNNPSKIFEDSLGNSLKKINEYKQLEKKYGFTFTSEFYKLISLLEKFIPIAAKWVRDCKGKNISDWYEYIWPVCDANDVDNWIKYEIRSDDINDITIIIMLDVSKADDTWITYAPATGLYGCDCWVRNLDESLKDCLLRTLLNEYEFREDMSDSSYEESIKLLKLYINFIKQNL